MNSQQPNGRRAYIAYLDSVDHFQPSGMRGSTGESMRTQVYRAVVAGYMAYLKDRGFLSLHVWASPPRTGEDFIFLHHPEAQKMPDINRLRRWYYSIPLLFSKVPQVTELT
jgi:E1A/CREB-binding protein